MLVEVSDTPAVFSDDINPSGCILCSRQNNSQHELPICVPAWPICIEIISLLIKKVIKVEII